MQEPPAAPSGRQPPQSRSPTRPGSPGHRVPGRAPTPSRMAPSTQDGVGVPKAPCVSTPGKMPTAPEQGRPMAPGTRLTPAAPKCTLQGGKSPAAAARPRQGGVPTAVTPRAPSPIKVRAPSPRWDARGDSQSQKNHREVSQGALGRGQPPTPRNSSSQTLKQDGSTKPLKTGPACCPPTPPAHLADGCKVCAAGGGPQETRQCHSAPTPRSGDAEGPGAPEDERGGDCGSEGPRGCWGHMQPPGYGKVVEELIRGPQPLRPVGLGNWVPKTPLPATLQPSSLPAGGDTEGPAAGGQIPQEARASKPRRCLRKPKRVPSIYKLKLQPKVRPRRDHRPGKRPSRIPTPLGQRTRAPRGQHRPPGPPQNPQPGSTHPMTKPSLSDSGAWLTEDDEEAWV